MKPPGYRRQRRENAEVDVLPGYRLRAVYFPYSAEACVHYQLHLSVDRCLERVLRHGGLIVEGYLDNRSFPGGLYLLYDIIPALGFQCSRLLNSVHPVAEAYGGAVVITASRIYLAVMVTSQSDACVNSSFAIYLPLSSARSEYTLHLS